MYIHFYSTNLALSEYNFTFNFCRKIIEKFGFKILIEESQTKIFGLAMIKLTLASYGNPKIVYFDPKNLKN